MKNEKSAGVIIFRKRDGKIEYLVLLRNPKYWDLPKGNIETREEEETAAKREVFEETGLKEIKIIPGFKEKEHYFYRMNNELISKDVVFFLAETKNEKVKISKEHVGFEWLTSEEAVKKVKSKETMKKADNFLRNQLTRFTK